MILDRQRRGVKVERISSRSLKDDDIFSIEVNPNVLFKFRHIHNDDFIDDMEQKFDFIKELSEGTYGKVVYAENRQTHRKIALKYATGEEFKIESLKNEASILKTLNHPCVVKCLDIHSLHQKGTCLVLEYVGGKTLYHKIVKPPNEHLSEAVTKFLFYQLCRAMEYLHNENVIHLDLKPDNILLANEEENFPLLEICDFGMSERIEDGNFLTTKLDVSNYTAPELDVAHKQLECTNKVDIWSMGVILFNCLSGQFPYKNHYSQIMAGVKFLKANIWDKVTNAAKNLITQMLRSNPNERPSIVDVFSHEWLMENDENVQRADFFF